MQNQTIAADATLVIIHTDSTLGTRASTIEILRAWANQQASEVSDQLGILLGLKASAFGTYTSTTPTPHFVNGPASAIAGGTAGAEATAGTDATAEGAGTVTPIIYEGFNNLNGYLWVPTPEERLIVPTDTAVILKLVGTPAALGNWSAGITFRELN
jgi:hypothetical protein